MGVPPDEVVATSGPCNVGVMGPPPVVVLRRDRASLLSGGTADF